MTHAIENTLDLPAATDDAPGLIKRLSVLAYGLVSYSIGCAGLFWLIFAVGGLAPVGLSALQTDSLVPALLINASLVLLFGLQHSVMARARFKSWLVQYIPAAAERATYMLMSGTVTIVAIYFWQPLPGNIWSVQGAGTQFVLWTLYALGWAYLLMSTFVTNHFELMGLRQVYLYFINKPYSKLAFTRRYMYRYSRHPMMLGMLVGMWATPEMSVSHFVMAILFTLYIFVGLFFEERDLLKEFGNTYRHYKKEIATFLPKVY